MPLGQDVVDLPAQDRAGRAQRAADAFTLPHLRQPRPGLRGVGLIEQVQIPGQVRKGLPGPCPGRPFGQPPLTP